MAARARTSIHRHQCQPRRRRRAPDTDNYPAYLSFSPGLECILENITGRENPTVVNRVVDSPEHGTFTEPLGRALTARIRLIGNKQLNSPSASKRSPSLQFKPTT
jgi:hypothetical protein